MEEWKEYKLGELYDVHNGLSKGGKFFGSGYPFLSFKTVFNNYFLPPVLPDLVQSNEKEQGGYDIKRGDVFVTRTSETPEELGMSSVALKDYPFATYNGFTKRLRPKNLSLIYPEFIGYYLRSRKFRGLFYGLASSMSTRASLANGDLLGMKVFLPSLETQKRIAGILKSLDDKIECNRRINENLEQQAQTLFKSWFVDFEPFKDQPFVESELGMIPQGWKVVYFKDFITPTTEKVPVGSLPEYSVTNNGIIPRDAKFNKKLSKETSKNKVLRKDNLVFGMSREILNWGIMEDEIGGVSSAYNVYKIDKGIIDPIYLRLYMKARISDFNSLIGTAAREGQSLDKGALMQKTVYVPSTKIIGEFFRLYFSIVALQKEAENESRRLAELRDTLLPRLMSGELKVNDVI